MKLNCWLIVGTMLSTSLLAQQATNAPSAAPATNAAPAPAIETPAAAPAITNAPAAPETTNAPAAKAEKPKSTKKKSAKKKSTPKTAVKSAPKKVVTYDSVSTPLVPGPATVVASNVNVRGQASLKGDVVTKITKGQEVTVLEEIVHNNSGPTEPSAWAKILLPPNAKVWVNSTFLNADKTVKPNRLKLRSGPGENYSMIGIIEKGQSVKEVTTKGDWTQIEPPTNAYAFVAAQYLRQEAGGAIASAATPAAPTNMVPETPTASETVAANPTVAAPPTDNPLTNAPTAPATETPAVTNAPTVAANSETNAPEAKTEEPLPPRIVSHEGIVRGMTSIQAPSHFELISADNGTRIDYLYTTSTNLDLRRYKGLHVVVTGEEGLDERWGNTPVLSIQRIQMVDDRSGQ